MPPIRFRFRWALIAIAMLALLATVVRPDAPKDPPFLTAIYSTIIVGALVQLLIDVVGLLPVPDSDASFPNPVPRDNPPPDSGRAEQIPSPSPAIVDPPRAQTNPARPAV